YWLLGLQINHYPLRMQRIALAGKLASEVRIALPISEVRPFHWAIAAGSEAAMRQRIRQNRPDRLLQFGAAGEIPALMCGIAPYTVSIPVPCRHTKLGVVTVSQRSPSGRKRFLNDVRTKNLID